jgi:uncharacterized ParB-like nuclease family protein
MITLVPTDKIDMRDDARAINQSVVSGLAESIAMIGLLNPIRVRRNGERWELTAGAHRLAACKSLGLADVEAIEIEETDLRAELAMIDENLMRAELSASERAQQTARRKAIYLELHPETANGATGERHILRQVGEVSADRFTVATAAATGQSERAIQRAAERGEKVIQAAIDIIKGTALDTGTYLDKLKKLSPHEQVTAAKRDLAWQKQQERERAKGGLARRVVKVADHPLSDEEASEAQYAGLVAAWNKAGETARQRFRELIDTPVMDRSAA